MGLRGSTKGSIQGSIQGSTAVINSSQQSRTRMFWLIPHSTPMLPPMARSNPINPITLSSPRILYTIMGKICPLLVTDCP